MVDVAGATTALHRTLLAWDYFDLCDKSDETGGIFDKLELIPDTFPSIEAYKKAFEPLLLEECCAQIMRGVEEGEIISPHPCVVAQHEDKGEFMHVRLALEAGLSNNYSDNDLVLLCKDNPEDPACTRELHCLGFCEAHEGNQSLRIKFMLTDDSQAGISSKAVMRVRAMRAGLSVSGSCWWLLKLSNMSTITREWIALQNAHICPFADILISGKPRALHESKHMDIPAGMRQTIEEGCNSSQMEALRAGLDGTPCVLIQGPPGTGKTRTIINLLSVVMHSASKGLIQMMGSEAVRKGHEMTDEDKLRLWSAQAPWLDGRTNGRNEVALCTNDSHTRAHVFGMLKRNAPVRVGTNSGCKAHVLVCAPSNSALDEIVIRILNSGLMDKDGKLYAPNIVRMGSKPHHSVRSVSVDAIVDSRLGGDDSKGVSRVERDRMRLAILDEASIVCSTLSFSGSSIFYRTSKKFDVVIIDEAAQAVEPSILVPLIMGCKQVFLVGDPAQLPATVISARAVDFLYDRSLFKRLQEGGHPVKVLDTQYRMHPAISSFPSSEFYNSLLLDGPNNNTECSRPWHDQPCFGPFAFFDVMGKESSPPGGASIQNIPEAHMVLCVYRELVHRYPELRNTPSVAVISPYKSQVKLLRDSFKAALGEEGARMVDINTIDGFQGREKDITIFSCVRALKKGSKKASIGFVADERRINVGLTRARCSSLVIGNVRALQVNSHWANLIHSALSTGCLYRPTAPYADWMTSCVEGKIPAVKPTAAELQVLEKARKKLSAAHKDKDEEALAQELHEDDDFTDYGALATFEEEEEEKQGTAEEVDPEAAERERDERQAIEDKLQEEIRKSQEAPIVLLGFAAGGNATRGAAAGGRKRGAAAATAAEPSEPAKRKRK